MCPRVSPSVTNRVSIWPRIRVNYWMQCTNKNPSTQSLRLLGCYAAKHPAECHTKPCGGVGSPHSFVNNLQYCSVAACAETKQGGHTRAWLQSSCTPILSVATRLLACLTRGLIKHLLKCFVAISCTASKLRITASLNTRHPKAQNIYIAYLATRALNQ